MASNRDLIFTKPQDSQFCFDEKVAAVFDDMLSRSVPYYSEFIRLSTSFILKNVKNKATIIDLGCSTGTLLLNLARLDKSLNLIGIDNSKAMCDIARKKAEAFNANIKFIEADILEYELSQCDCVILNFTLQFIRPPQRERLIRQIFSALKENGILILSEKLISEHKKLDKQMIEEYYDFKRAMGYSDLEIMQKREALENVLIPYTQEENIKLLKDAGFFHVELLFRWVNFALFLSVKSKN